MQIDIFEKYDYCIEELLLDKPCKVSNDINIYPIRLGDMKEFSSLSHFLTINKEEFNITNDSDVLKYTVGINVRSEEDLIKNVYSICELLTLITRQEIKFKDSQSEKIMFEGNGFVITEFLFEDIRQVVLKQNLLHIPKYYKDKLVKEWADRVKKARMKKNGIIEIYDIMNMIRVEIGTSYGEMNNYNIFQLYSEYARLIHNKGYDATILFRTAGSDVAIIDYSDGVIKNLFKNPDETLFKNSNDSKLGGFLK